MKNWQRFSAFYASAALALTLTACGGGQNATVPTARIGGGAIGSSVGVLTTARLKITIPRAASSRASSRRRPQYISPATQALAVTITGGPTALSEGINLTTSNPTCQVNLYTTLACTVSLTLSPCPTSAACYTGTFTTYDQAYTNTVGGSCTPLTACTQPVGTNALSQAQSVNFPIVEGVANNLPITLGGVPASVTIVADSGSLSGNALTYFTLPTGQNAQVTALGVDADGNYILGPGAPAVTLTTSDATQFTVSTPTTSAPNLFTITNASSNPAGAVLTATVTPTTVSGASSLSATVGIVSQPPTLYVTNLNNSTVTAYDSQGAQQTLTGTFPSPYVPGGIAYDTANGWLYVARLADDVVDSTVKAYDLQGNLQTLTGNWPNLNEPGAITYDPANGWLYVLNDNDGGSITAYNSEGAQQTLTGNFPNVSSPSGMAYNPADGLLYVTNGGSNKVTVYDGEGVQQTVTGTFPGIDAPEAITYDPANGWLYVPDNGSTVTAYNTEGAQQALTGSPLFPNLNGGCQIAFNPANGWLYVTSPPNNTVTAYSSQGAQQTLSFPNLDSPDSIVVVP